MLIDCSDQRNELPLGFGIALDVALRHGQAGMSGELLHVPQTPPHFRNLARRARDEGPAPGVRRAPSQLQRPIEPMKPQLHPFLCSCHIDQGNDILSGMACPMNWLV
jgi:hypothetical protein